MSEPPTVLFEDNHCLAVAKPAPLLTQAPPGVPSLEAMVKEYLKQKYQKAGNVYLGIPHRLDRPVSGVVLFARNSKAAQRLAEQFALRQVTKVYVGLTLGKVEPAEGRWEDWLRKVASEARSERADPGSPGAKFCSLRYRVLRQDDCRALVEFIPETGRMHQIRAQAALHGHPLLGDALYGASEPFGPLVATPRERIIALHARSLTFLHPIRYEPITVESPLPPGFEPGPA